MNDKAIDTLRKLVDRQQFAALREACLTQDIRDPAMAILLTLAHLGELVDAEERIARVLPIQDSLDIDARADLAAVFILRQNIDKAIDHLEIVLEQDPDHALAQVESQEQNFDLAEKLFREILRDG